MTLKRWIAGLLALTMVFAFSACGEKDSSGAVAKIGDTEISEAELETYSSITCMMYYGMDYSTVDADNKTYMKQMMVSGLLDMKLAEKYCEDKKIDVKAQDQYEENRKEFLKSVKEKEELKKIVKNCNLTEEQLEAYYYGIGAGNAIYDEVTGAIKDLDAQIAAYYEKNKAELYTAKEKESTVSHIVVKDESTAKEVSDKLAAGGDFAELAKEYSTDGSASQGGLLGTYTKSNCGWVEAFKEAAFAMKEGEISKPVKSEFGYHIIYVSKCTEAGTVKPLEEVKGSIEQQIVYRAYSEKMAQLQKEYSAEILLKAETMPEVPQSSSAPQAEQ